MDEAYEIQPEESALRPIDELAEEYGLKPWEAAAMARFARWRPGKSVTAEEYAHALDNFRVKPLGGKS